MVVIPIQQPRWHDRTILVAKWRVGDHNEVRVNHSSFKEPLYMSGEKMRKYPIEKKTAKNGQLFEVYVVPISDFMTLSERNEILNQEKEIVWQTPYQVSTSTK